MQSKLNSAPALQIEFYRGREEAKSMANKNPQQRRMLEINRIYFNKRAWFGT